MFCKDIDMTKLKLACLFARPAGIVALLDIKDDFNIVLLVTHLENTKEEGTKIILIIDESHFTAKTETSRNLIEDINGVDNAFGYTLNPAKAEFNNKVRFTYVVGIPPDPEELKVLGTGLDVGEGRQLKKGDVSKVVLGYDISHRDSMFGKEVKIGDKILIEGKSFDVVGVRKRIGNPIQDESFLIPLDTFRDIFNLEDDLSIIAANINANENVDVIAEKIKKEMRRDRHLKEGEEDFQVQTSEEVIASFNVVLQIVQAVLIGIAAFFGLTSKLTTPLL